MPIYVFRCPQCGKIDEVLLSPEQMYEPRQCCMEMQRLMTMPQPPIMKKTANDWTLDSLNSRDTSHMKEEVKQKAMQGLELPQKEVW